MKKTVSGLLLTSVLILLLTSTLILVVKISSVRATWNGPQITINSDGSITPSSAPILRAGSNYFLTDNITFTGSSIGGIWIKRNNIVLDGEGYTVKGNPAYGNSFSVYLQSMSGVTVRNTKITSGAYGIQLITSSGNTLSGNTVMATTWGIYIEGSSNTLSGNTLTNNYYYNIFLESSSSNTISSNTVTGNNAWGYAGICLDSSSNNVLSGNNVGAMIGPGIELDSSSGNTLSGNAIGGTSMVNWGGGVVLSSSSNNNIFHNSFLNNYGAQAKTDYSPNTWDNGYPSGGNYWSDYATKYPNATEVDSSGIWNTPYVINASNLDRDPLMSPWGYPPTYSATINAYCKTEQTTVAVPITEDGSATGYNTPHTFSGLSGSHTFTVPSTDAKGDPFLQWNTGQTSTTITAVPKALGNYTAYYQTPLSVNISPSSSTFDVGQSQLFTSTVSGGTPPYTYQWHLNGAPVSGATNSNWTFTPVSAGSYTVYLKVNDSAVQVLSNTAAVTVKIHDVAVLRVKPSETVVGQGFSVNINVTVANQGNYSETFKVTLYVNATSVASQNVTVASGKLATIVFAWNTTGFNIGNYTISAYALPVSGEIDVANNTFIDDMVQIFACGGPSLRVPYEN